MRELPKRVTEKDFEGEAATRRKTPRRKTGEKPRSTRTITRVGQGKDGPDRDDMPRIRSEPSAPKRRRAKRPSKTGESARGSYIEQRRISKLVNQDREHFYSMARAISLRYQYVTNYTPDHRVFPTRDSREPSFSKDVREVINKKIAKKGAERLRVLAVGRGEPVHDTTLLVDIAEHCDEIDCLSPGPLLDDEMLTHANSLFSGRCGFSVVKKEQLAQPYDHIAVFGDTNSTDEQFARLLLDKLKPDGSITISADAGNDRLRGNMSTELALRSDLEVLTYQDNVLDTISGGIISPNSSDAGAGEGDRFVWTIRHKSDKSDDDLSAPKRRLIPTTTKGKLVAAGVVILTASAAAALIAVETQSPASNTSQCDSSASALRPNAEPVKTGDHTKSVLELPGGQSITVDTKNNGQTTVSSQNWITSPFKAEGSIPIPGSNSLLTVFIDPEGKVTGCIETIRTPAPTSSTTNSTK